MTDLLRRFLKLSRGFNKIPRYTDCVASQHGGNFSIILFKISMPRSIVRLLAASDFSVYQITVILLEQFIWRACECGKLTRISSRIIIIINSFGNSSSASIPSMKSNIKSRFWFIIASHFFKPLAVTCLIFCRKLKFISTSYQWYTKCILHFWNAAPRTLLSQINISVDCLNLIEPPHWNT